MDAKLSKKAIEEALVGLGFSKEFFVVLNHVNDGNVVIFNWEGLGPLRDDIVAQGLAKLLASGGYGMSINYYVQKKTTQMDYFMKYLDDLRVKHGNVPAKTIGEKVHDNAHAGMILQYDTSRYKILKLSVHKAAFDVMASGEKTREFRKYTDWINSRLFDKTTGKPKEYDFIEIRNGYGEKKPVFWAKWRGFLQLKETLPTKHYSNGLVVEDYGLGDFVLFLGDIVSHKNFDLPEKFERDENVTWELPKHLQNFVLADKKDGF